MFRRAACSPIAIDFRDSSVTMTQYRLHGGEWRRHACGERRIEPQAGLDETLRAFSDAMASLMKHRPFAGRTAVATMPPAHLETRPVRLPAGIASEDHPGFFHALVQEARTFLSFDPAEAVLDYLPIGMERFEAEERLSVILFAAPAAAVAGYLALLRDAGLYCEKLEFSPCAFMRGAPPSERAVAFVELNARHTSVSILHEGRLLFNRMVAAGLGDAVDALRDDLKVSRGEAWALLRRYGIDHQAVQAFNINWVLECGVIGPEHIASKLFHIGRASFDRVANEVRRSLNYYTNHRRGEGIDRILLGGELPVPGIERLFKDRLGYTVLFASDGDGSGPESNQGMSAGLALGSRAA